MAHSPSCPNLPSTPPILYWPFEHAYGRKGKKVWLRSSLPALAPPRASARRCAKPPARPGPARRHAGWARAATRRLPETRARSRSANRTAGDPRRAPARWPPIVAGARIDPPGNHALENAAGAGAARNRRRISSCAPVIPHDPPGGRSRHGQPPGRGLGIYTIALGCPRQPLRLVHGLSGCLPDGSLPAPSSSKPCISYLSRRSRNAIARRWATGSWLRDRPMDSPATTTRCRAELVAPRLAGTAATFRTVFAGPRGSAATASAQLPRGLHAGWCRRRGALPRPARPNRICLALKIA
jgi:hypothetical protein